MPLMINCTEALTSFSDRVSYITFLFSKWRIVDPNPVQQILRSTSFSKKDLMTLRVTFSGFQNVPARMQTKVAAKKR